MCSSRAERTAKRTISVHLHSSLIEAAMKRDKNWDPRSFDAIEMAAIDTSQGEVHWPSRKRPEVQTDACLDEVLHARVSAQRPIAPGIHESDSAAFAQSGIPDAACDRSDLLTCFAQRSTTAAIRTPRAITLTVYEPPRWRRSD